MKVQFWLPWIPLLSLFLGGCVHETVSIQSGKETPTQEEKITATVVAAPVISPSVNDGSKLYDQYCASCHEVSAQAQPTTEQPVGVISAEWIKQTTPADMFSMITSGVPEKGMSAFDQLSTSDRWDLVSYLLLKDFTVEDQRSGKLAYQNLCTSCHGEAGQGDGTQAFSKKLTLQDWQNQPLMVNDSNLDLFTTIRSGSGHGTGMFAVMLDESQIWSLVNIVRMLSVQEQMNFDPLVQATNDEQSAVGNTTQNEGFFILEGKVINASGGTVNTDNDVKLYVLYNGQTLKELSTPLIADSSFRFYLVPYNPAWSYVASFSSKGIVFRSDVLKGEDTASAKTASLSIRVFDANSDSTILTGERMHVLLNFAKEDSVHVVENILIANPSSFVAVPENTTIPLLTFIIAANAQGLKFSDPSNENYLKLIQGGLGDWQPIFPGNVHQVMFEYDLPFDGNDLFSFKVPVRTRSIMVMIEDSSGEVTCNGLQHIGEKADPSGGFDILSGSNVNTGGQFSIRCYNKKDIYPEIIGSAVFLFVLAIVTIIVIDSRRQHKNSLQSAVKNNKGTQVTLLDAIIALDDQYKAGEISAEAYQTKREELLKKLVGE